MTDLWMGVVTKISDVLVEKGKARYAVLQKSTYLEKASGRCNFASSYKY